MSVVTPKNRRKIFVRGFLRGLAAPAYAFETHVLPDLVIPQITPFCGVPDAQKLRGDWSKIGNDIESVVTRNGKKFQSIA
jgi:hypothetical protein